MGGGGGCNKWMAHFEKDVLKLTETSRMVTQPRKPGSLGLRGVVVTYTVNITQEILMMLNINNYLSNVSVTDIIITFAS